MKITIIKAHLPVQNGLNACDYVSDDRVFDRWYESQEAAKAALEAVRLGEDENGVDLVAHFVEVEADLDDENQHWDGRRNIVKA